MKLYNLRLLVNDFDECFKFYSEIMEFEVVWGKPGGDYASFKSDNKEFSLSIFKSDLMDKAIGNSSLYPENGFKDKTVLVIQVESVDRTFEKLSDKGVNFINKPVDIAGWGSRVVHLRDTEGNLIELFSELPKDKWSADLIEESENY